MHVFLSEIRDTAYVKDFTESELVALCDNLNVAITASRSQVVKLRWTKQDVRSRGPDLLWIIRFWVTPRGVRKLRIQAYKIYPDGRFGRRQIWEERHQGRIVR